MKRLIFIIWAISLSAAAQTVNYTPTPLVLMTSSNGLPPFAPLTSASGLFAVNFTPDFIVPMCSATGLPPFSQCSFAGSGGTVTNFSAGNLSPLFTTSVATPTATPSLSFSLSNAAANTVFGNFTGSPAGPTFTAAPTFSAANLTNFPTFNQNTSGTAANLSGTPALPNGTTATTQTAADNTTKLATDAFVQTAVSGAGIPPLGTAGQVPVMNAGATAYAPVSLSQDCTNTSTGVVTCLKTNNVSFTSAATTAIGTSGATIPLLSTANTWTLGQTDSALHTFSLGANIASGQVLSWNADSGISRASAATFDFGNGTQGSITGSLDATSYQASTAAVINTSGFMIGSTVPFSFSSTSAFSGSKDTSISRGGIGILDVGTGAAGNAGGTVNAAAYQIAGTALAASNLSNGVTGSGAVVLAVSPALTSTPTAPTASGGTNTTQIATTAFVQSAISGALAPATIGTATNCSSSAAPAVCGSAAAGSVVLPTNVTSSSVTVNTSAVTANSQIFAFTDDTLGTKLGVTCNSTVATLVGGLTISARTAGTSFTISNNVAVAVNPLCVSYLVVN